MRSTVGIMTSAAVVMVMAGCGLGGTSAPPAASPTASEAAPPASMEPGGATPASPAPPASGSPTDDPSATPGDLGPVVATRTSSTSGEEVRLQLYPLIREGSVTHLNLTISSADNNQISGLLADGDYKAGDFSGHAADGITLVDGKHNKLYLVASDGRGNCLCSRDLAGVFLKDDEPFLVSATFAAPPADVTTVDVRLPSFGVVSRVPIT